MATLLMRRTDRQSQQSLLEALHAENIQFSSDLDKIEYIQEHVSLSHHMP